MTTSTGLRIIECGNGFLVEYDNAKCRDILKELMFSAVESIRGRVCQECKWTGSQEEDACVFCWGHGFVESALQPEQAATVSELRRMNAETMRDLQHELAANAELTHQIIDLRAALEDVIRVADRDTKEFNAARAALASSTAAPAPVIPESDSFGRKYRELLRAVSKKFPGESLHETALRYIQTHDRVCGQGGPAKDASPEKDHG